MGLVVCHNPGDVKAGFKTVRSRGETLFKSKKSGKQFYSVANLLQMPGCSLSGTLLKAITSKSRCSATAKEKQSTLASENALSRDAIRK